MIKSKYLLRFCLLLCLPSLVPGCGRKTMIIPPESQVPAAIKDLQAVIRDGGVRLSWSYPQETAAGADLTEPVVSFELFRAEVPAVDYCAECPQPFVIQARIPGDRRPAAGDVRSVTYDDIDLRSGYYYTYKVRASVGWWSDSEDSNVVSFVWEEPATAPLQ
jgi:hypothetical protein